MCDLDRTWSLSASQSCHLLQSRAVVEPVAEDQKLRTGIMEDVILLVGQIWRKWLEDGTWACL